MSTRGQGWKSDEEKKSPDVRIPITQQGLTDCQSGLKQVGKERAIMTDHDTNFVYVSDLLAGRFPSIYEGLERILGGHGIGFGVVRGTKDIWIRD